MSLIIMSPGILTTVQDGGRKGYAAQGYRACGAADEYARRLGNALVGNKADAAVLECTLQGAEIRFDEDTVIALTGAESPATLDGEAIPYYAPIFASSGSVLTMGMAASGVRSYLAVYGGIDTDPVRGSRSTDLKCHLGGHEGRALRAEDALPAGADSAAARMQWSRIEAAHAVAPLTDPAVTAPRHPWIGWDGALVPSLRCVAGPQEDAFTEEGLRTFTHSVYALSADCDRMACKLTGDAIEMVHGADILSDGIAAGSVQVSANGQPIVMLADHQTTGGYAKVATVISADLSVLAQMRPGARVSFQFVSPADAVQAAREQAAVIAQIKSRY